MKFQVRCNPCTYARTLRIYTQVHADIGIFRDLCIYKYHLLLVIFILIALMLTLDEEDPMTMYSPPESKAWVTKLTNKYIIFATLTYN